MSRDSRRQVTPIPRRAARVVRGRTTAIGVHPSERGGSMTDGGASAKPTSIQCVKITKPKIVITTGPGRAFQDIHVHPPPRTRFHSMARPRQCSPMAWVNSARTSLARASHQSAESRPQLSKQSAKIVTSRLNLGPVEQREIVSLEPNRLQATLHRVEQQNVRPANELTTTQETGLCPACCQGSRR